MEGTAIIEAPFDGENVRVEIAFKTESNITVSKQEFVEWITNHKGKLVAGKESYATDCACRLSGFLRL